MIKQGLVCILAGSLLLTSCAAQNGQNADQTQTVLEGAGIGVLAGALIGGLAGGGRGAAMGAGIGGLLGTAAGGYVAQQKKKYATIEQRIAGERQLTAQATATAQAQTAASAAQLEVVDAQLRDLGAAGTDSVQRRATASAMLASLQKQRTDLEADRKQLETRLKNQQAFIVETEKEIGNNDPDKAAQLAQWKADIPGMQTAVTAMSTQIAEVSARENQVQRVSAGS
jgi:hypothetical protein